MEREILFRGFCPNKNGKQIITLDGEDIRGDWVYGDDGCPVETPKDSRNIVTNADRIRSMSDEELARFLRNIRDCGDYEELKFIGGVYMDYVSVIEWLKQPVKEE